MTPDVVFCFLNGSEPKVMQLTIMRPRNPNYMK